MFVVAEAAARLDGCLRVGRQNSRWAREFHRKEATAAARRGFYRRFEREVDPVGGLV